MSQHYSLRRHHRVDRLAAAFVTAQIRRQIRQSLLSVEERDCAIGIFGRYVSPQIARKLLAQDFEAPPEIREVCVMFLDIRDFTKTSDVRSPNEVMNYLNVLFSPMIEIVNQHQGVINKFLGDGFMAVFGAPTDDGEACCHAVQAAVELVREVKTSTARP